MGLALQGPVTRHDATAEPTTKLPKCKMEWHSPAFLAKKRLVLDSKLPFQVRSLHRAQELAVFPFGRVTRQPECLDGPTHLCGSHSDEHGNDDAAYVRKRSALWVGAGAA